MSDSEPEDAPRPMPSEGEKRWERAESTGRWLLCVMQTVLLVALAAASLPEPAPYAVFGVLMALSSVILCLTTAALYEQVRTGEAFSRLVFYAVTATRLLLSGLLLSLFPYAADASPTSVVLSVCVALVEFASAMMTLMTGTLLMSREQAPEEGMAAETGELEPGLELE